MRYRLVVNSCWVEQLTVGSDIHPWDILINGERWAGKVRLVGFVDSFFLICYSGESRFEHGIVVYSQSSDSVLRLPLCKLMPHRGRRCD